MPDFNEVWKAPSSLPVAAAKRRAAASSVAFVASGYERSLRPSIACFSLATRRVT
jgi:hypothetical protein